MTRMPRLRRLPSLHPPATSRPTPSSSRPPLACLRPLSTTCPTRGKNTDWVRAKLWKGDAPGPKDPYTQPPPPEEAQARLPEEVTHRPRPIDRTPAAMLNSRLRLPPRRTEALPERDVKVTDPSYIPATDAAGLEQTGTLKTWWEEEGHWGEESQFRGFGRARRVLDRYLVEVYLREAVVEALSLRETGSWAEWGARKWRVVSGGELDRILGAELGVGEDGRGGSLRGEDAAVISRSLVPTDERGTTVRGEDVTVVSQSVVSTDERASLRGEDAAVVSQSVAPTAEQGTSEDAVLTSQSVAPTAEQGTSEDAVLTSQSVVSTAEQAAEGMADGSVTPEEGRDLVRRWGASWKELVLDEELKFAIRKRLYQLTGILIPDARLAAARTVKHVLTLTVKKPEAPKLADVLARRSDMQQLANVKVHSRKIGPMEKETSVGRWKVIEEELTKRGLPVTGTAGLTRHKERDWISGKI